MKNRQLGLIVAIAGILLLALIISLVPTLKHLNEDSCSCSLNGETCPHEKNLPYQIYIGIGLVILIFYLSYYLFTKKELSERKIEIPKDLSPDEKLIVDALIEAKGFIFQSDLVEKLGLSKVKVTRLLDKLEARGLIERHRRGMTNAVLLKGKETEENKK